MTERVQIVDICIRHPDDGRFLVVTNKRYGGFTTPGGKVDEGEVPREAAIRELKEETGLDPIDLTYIGCFEFNWREKPLRVYQFLANLGDQEPKEVEEGTTPYWVERDELLVEPCLAPVSYGWLFGKMDW